MTGYIYVDTEHINKMFTENIVFYAAYYIISDLDSQKLPVKYSGLYNATELFMLTTHKVKVR